MNKEEVLAQLEKLKTQLKKFENTHTKTKKAYIVDYSRLSPVHNGYVDPGILALYK